MVFKECCMTKSIRPWKVISSEVVVRDEWLMLRADVCETEDGVRIAPYYVQEVCDWVHIVGLNDQGEMLLNEQYRHGTQQVCLELPSGGIELDETPLQAAQREFLEETGCLAREWIALPPVSPNPAGLTNTIHPFLARGVCKVQPQELEPGEEITCSFMSVAQVFDLIRGGRFPQALHIATVMVALEHTGWLKLNAVDGKKRI